MTTSGSKEIGVILPCDTAHFGQFVSGLLGKPQTIEKSLHGVFEINSGDVTNTYHLVNQRINQQNEATLIQFTVKIIYNDDSSVLINSLEDFQAYTEVRPLISTGVSLSWSYLVKFKNKDVPERQNIDLSFRSGADDGIGAIVEDGIIIRKGYRRGWYRSGAFIRIEHTERTWGIDIESLLTGHIKGFMKSPDSKTNIIYKNSGPIGFIVGVLFFLGAIAGSIYTSSQFIESYIEKLKLMTEKEVIQSDLLLSKIDFLIEIISTGAWPKFIFAVVAFVTLSAIASIFIGIYVSEKAENSPSSFVLLSKSAITNKTKVEERLSKSWHSFWVSIFSSIAAGLISNYIFAYYFGTI